MTITEDDEEEEQALLTPVLEGIKGAMLATPDTMTRWLMCGGGLMCNVRG